MADVFFYGLSIKLKISVKVICQRSITKYINIQDTMNVSLTILYSVAKINWPCFKDFEILLLKNKKILVWYILAY